MTPQEILHSILLDAKARIKDGELYHDEGDISGGICSFVCWHLKSNIFIHAYLNDLIMEHKKVNEDYIFCGVPFDFTDPKRLALLDWLIERTAP